MSQSKMSNFRSVEAGQCIRPTHFELTNFDFVFRWRFFLCFWVLSLIRLFKNSKYYIWCNSLILFVFLEVASFGRRPFLPIIIVLHFFSTSWKIIRKSKKSPAEFSIFHAYSRLVMNKRKLTVFNGTKFKCISLSLEHAMAFKDDLPIILNFKTENLPSARKEENSSKRRLNLNSRSEIDFLSHL